MKVLVTGGGGFLGQAVVRCFLKRGHPVRSFSRGRYPELAGLGVEVLQGDLGDEAAVREACRGCDAVVHVAAKAGLWGDYEDFYAANVVGTGHVLSGCRQTGVSRLVYTSSPSVVFDGTDLEGADESIPYPDRYKAAYPQTKAIAERMVLAADGPSLATVSLRPHLIWGPGDPHLIPGILSRARSGRLRRIGREDKIVDFTFVANAAVAHLLAAERLEPGSAISGKAYFITQGEPVPLWGFINRILDLAGIPPVEGSVDPRIAYGLGWLLEKLYGGLGLGGEPALTRFLVEELATSHWFDITAARRDLGYEPVVSLGEGLELMKEWILAGESRPDRSD